MSTEHKATAIAGANIALIKYWGNRDVALRIPMNNSISITLDNANTVTTVALDNSLDADTLHLNDEPAPEAALKRVQEFMDAMRYYLEFEGHVRIVSRNNFPTASGIASSASAFAALATAVSGALDLQLPPEQLSALARLGSGSAARSVIGGYVEWQTGTAHDDSFASQLAPPIYWEVVDLIAVVSTTEKVVKSTAGHQSAMSSPLYNARLVHVRNRLAPIRRAIEQRDFAMLGRITEQDALSMHAIMMTSDPALLYWEPGTMEVMHAVRAWREEGLEAYFTTDAGPNVHVLTTAENTAALRENLESLPAVREVITCRPGAGARLVDAHLF